MSGSDRAVVVTGATRGIGLATALAFARRGRVVAMLGRASSHARAALDQVKGVDERAYFEPCDVASEAEVLRAAESVLGRSGAPEVVVNNAGVALRGPLVEEITLAEFERVLSVNLTGAFLVSRAFLPAMRAQGRGRLVHVGSISSTIGCPRAAAYAASKWGLVGLGKSIAEELSGSGLASVMVLPGSVDTDMLTGSGFDPDMSADDIANTICYLGLDAPVAINGSAIEIFG